MIALGACSGPVEVPLPDLDAKQQAACEKFLDEIPDPLVNLERVEVDPPDALAQAFSDPPVVIACVDSVPADFDEFAFCVEVSGVGWYLPDAQLKDESIDATFTAVGYDPMVSVRVPGEFRQVTGGDILSDLADPVQDNLQKTKPCR